MVIGAGGAVGLEHRTVASPDAGEIRLRMRVVGLCGTDLFKIVNRTEPEGTVLGHELVGTVDAVGADVTGIAVGERVVVPHHVSCGRCRFCGGGNEPLCPEFRRYLLAPGGFSSRLIVRPQAVKHALYRPPADLPDESAVFLEPMGCVVRGVVRSDLMALDAALPRWAAVLGAGSMGLLHLLVLKGLDAGIRVLVVDPVGERRNLAESLGADATCAPEDMGSRSTELSGEGFDTVFDTVGGAARLGDGLGILRGGGSIVLFAHAAAEEPADFDLNRFFKGEKRIIATYSGSLEDQRIAWSLLLERKVDPSPLVSHVLPLSEFQRGMELALERKAMKVLFVGDGDE